MSIPPPPPERPIRPPAAAVWLLRRLLPREFRDAFLGDALERHRRDCAERGRLTADLALWREVLTSRWLTLRSRTRKVGDEMHGGTRAPGAPLPARLIEHITSDAKHGLRGLARAPGFALAAILTVGLGSGAATAVFSLVDGVLLRPLPFREPERLVNVFDANAQRGLAREPISPVSFMDYRAADRVFEDAAAWWRPETNLADESGAPLRVSSIEVSENLFDVLGVQPVLGRAFPRDSTLFGSEAEVVISHRLWRDRFAADPGVLSRTVRLNGAPYTVVGVMPPGFNYPDDTDVWERLQWNLIYHSRAAHFMGAVARVRPGVPLERVNAELADVSLRLERDFPATNTSWRAYGVPVAEVITGAYRPALVALMVAAAVLLLIACMNVANLLLARSTTRTAEIALRAALGAGRARLVGQLLTESALIAGLGSALGFASALLALRAFASWSPIQIPRADLLTVSGTVLGFALGCAAVTTLLFGLAPAVVLSRARALGREIGRNRGGGASRAQQRARGTLVAVQLALAVVLLAGAGLLIRSVTKMVEVDAGVRGDRVVTANLELTGDQYRSWGDVQRFYAELVDELALRPGVAAAGVSNFLPLEAGWRMPFLVPGEPTDPSDAPVAQYHTVDERWFATLGVPIVAGRGFTADDDADAPGVIVVNEALVRRHFPGENVVGRTLTITQNGIGPLGRRLVDSTRARLDVQIVGVAGDVRNASSTSRGIVAGTGSALASDAEPALYFAQRQFPFRNMHVFARGPIAAGALLGLLRDAVASIDPALPLAEERTLARVLQTPADPNRLVMAVLAVFAAAALALAAIGIYGILSYAVETRRREIGIRLALGAAPARVTSMIMKQGIWLGLIGGAAGLVGALLGGRLLSSLLFQVSATDPLTLASVVVVVVATALLACWIPGRRAAALDPARTLGAE